MAGQMIPNQIGRGSVPFGTGSSPRLRMLGQHGGGFSYGENPGWYQEQGKKYGWDMSQFGGGSSSTGVIRKPGGSGTPSTAGIQPPRTGTNPFGSANKPGGSFGTTTPTNGGGFGSLGGGMNINTTIQPKPLYTPQMTQWGVNQLKADAAQKSNLPWLMKQYDTPGVSRSEGTMGLVAPQAGNIMAGGDDAAANLMLGDEIANQKQLLAGQIARSNEAYSLGNLYTALQESQDRFNQGQFGNTMGLMRYLG